VAEWKDTYKELPEWGFHLVPKNFLMSDSQRPFGVVVRGTSYYCMGVVM